MKTLRPAILASAVAAALVVFATPGSGIAATASSSMTATVAVETPSASGDLQLAQDGGTEPPELQPRYEPVPPRPEGSYNNQYIFGLTRGVADAPMAPAAKVLLFPITVPLDLVLLPFAAIGGFFG